MKTLLVCLVALTLPLSLSAQDAKQDKAKSKLDRQDKRSLRDMGEADMAEVQAGKLASQKASSPEVKKFAQEMVDDHGKGLSEDEALARSKAMQPPSAPSKKHQSAMKKMESLSGEEFDRAYMQQMVKDHEETLKKLQDAAKNAKDPQIKAAASKKAPIVSQHLEMARSLSKGDAAAGGGKKAK
jgi:putative membrane protein